MARARLAEADGRQARLLRGDLVVGLADPECRRGEQLLHVNVRHVAGEAGDNTCILASVMAIQESIRITCTFSPTLAVLGTIGITNAHIPVHLVGKKPTKRPQRLGHTNLREGFKS